VTTTQTRTMNQIANGYTPDISLEIFRTGIFLLHAHPQVQVVNCNCVKFHQYGLIC